MTLHSVLPAPIPRHEGLDPSPSDERTDMDEPAQELGVLVVEDKEKPVTSKKKRRSRVSEGGEGLPVDAVYKVLLLGDSGVGKSALIRSLMRNDFSQTHLTTVGIDFVKRTFAVDGAQVQLQIWDTAGQERFRSITKFQYRGTKGLLLVYDVTDKSSFQTLGYWLDSIDKELDCNNKEPIPVFIVGNKIDLEQQRVITTQMGKKAAKSHYVHGFLETSAKEGTNVDVAFGKLAYAITEINNKELMDMYLDEEGREMRDMERSQPVPEVKVRSKGKRRMKGLRKNLSRIKLCSKDQEGNPTVKCSCV